MGWGRKWLLFPSICTVLLSKLCMTNKPRKIHNALTSKTPDLSDSVPQHSSMYLDTNSVKVMEPSAGLLPGQVKNRRDICSATMWCLTSPTQLYVLHMPGSLSKGSPLGSWWNSQGQSHSDGYGSAYCAMRPCHRMEHSQGKHADCYRPSAQELHPWRTQQPHVAAPH